MTTKLVVPVLLVCLAVGQGVRVEWIAAAEESTAPTPVADSTPVSTEREADREGAAVVKQSRELQDAPYRIGPPDVLEIAYRSVPLQFKGPDGTLLHCAGFKRQVLVDPSGKIELDGLGGKLYAVGLTVEDLCKAIRANIQKRCQSDELDIEVRVVADNHRVVYVISKGQPGEGDRVCRIPWTPHKTTVLQALASATWPQPVDLGACQIEVRRPVAPSGQKQQVVSIAYDGPVEQTAQPVATQTNQDGVLLAGSFLLLPGDRVVVTPPASNAGYPESNDDPKEAAAERRDRSG